MAEPRVMPLQELAQWLKDARRRTLAVAAGLAPEQMIGPYRATVNPILWALGHVAFFQERWAWCHLRRAPPLHPGMELLYDSFEVEHPARWKLPLPDVEHTHAYLASVLEHVLQALKSGNSAAAEDIWYFHALTVFHEDMHAEAIAYDRDTLGYPAPERHDVPGADPALDTAALRAGPWPGDVEIPGSEAYWLGAAPGTGFVFDNEKWAHPVKVAPFRIARAPVTNGEYAAFVEAGGYRTERYWSPAAWRWLREAGLEHPQRWRRAPGGGWQVRHYDRWLPLPEHQPVVHVSWHEARAWCAWAGRRLPTEAEWELAASTVPGAGTTPAEKRAYPWGEDTPSPAHANLDARIGQLVDVAAFPAGDSAWGCRQMFGNVWEWTADAFYPYPGFVVDPYKEYSAPWFGYHKVLRGGCWATRGRLLRNTWRNFFMPHRTDIIAGFRTCAP